MSSYPHTCPVCKQPAFVGVVPAAVTCSNPFCRHAENKRSPQYNDLVTVKLQYNSLRSLTSSLAKADGRRVRICSISRLMVEAVDQDDTTFILHPEDIVELVPYLEWDAVAKYYRVPDKHQVSRPWPSLFGAAIP